MKRRLLRLRPAFSVLFSLLWLGPFCILGGAEAPLAPPPSVTSTQTVYLDYREFDYGLINWGIPAALQSESFKKEPDLSRHRVYRGTLKFGNSTGHFIGFLWDRTQGKLYLDLNRNQDLTDDPAGVFSAKGPLGDRQSFTDAHLSFNTPAGNHPAFVDFWFYAHGANVPDVSVACRYCWEARASVAGREWHLGLTDNLTGDLNSPTGGHLILRPWSARNQPCFLQGGSLDGFRSSRQLFFSGQAFQLEQVFVQQDNQPKYRIDLKPQRAELGELKLTGKYIKRLLLTREGGEPLTVVFDSPEALVNIPVGRYTQCSVNLRQGEAEACRSSDRYNSASLAPAITVNTSTPAALNVGGPLTNSVSASRRGRSLDLRYQLLGANSEAYVLQGERRQPEFAVYRGNRKIASGKFQFG